MPVSQLIDTARRWSQRWRDLVALSADQAYGARAHTDFLPSALSVAETPPHPALGWVLRLVVALLVFLLVWASIGRIDIIARAGGQTVPAGRLKVVQAMESARIRQILVREGERVRSGQPLVRLDPTSLAADVSRTQRDAHTAIDKMRVAAVLLDRLGLSRPAPVLPSDHDPTASDFQVEAEWRSYESGLRKMDDEIAAVRAQHQGALAESAGLRRRLPLLQERNAAHQKLVDQGFFPRMQLLEEVSEVYAVESQLEVLQRRQAELAAQIEAALAGRLREVATFRSQVVQRYLEAARELGTAAPELSKARWRLDGMDLRAPIDGVVQKLTPTTVGQVIQGGEPVVEVVSGDQSMVVEVQILNKDRGFVREGQPADVAFEAFPANRFGVATGRVSWISADAETIEDVGAVYRARVELSTEAVRAMPAPFALTPGLRATADIRTGRRPVIEFFLAPIFNAARTALRER